MKANIKFSIIIVSLLLINLSSFSATTPASILNSVAAKIGKAGSVVATFNFSGNGHSGMGSLKISGKKFSIQVPGTSTWYNGKNMWTYSASTKETTLITPSAAEIAESNPLTYLSQLNSFNCSFASGDTPSKRVINLIPKSKKIGVKKIVATIESKSLKPLQLSVTSTDGKVSTIKITGFQIGKALPSSNFEYPKNNFPKIKIIDLR